MYIEKNGKDYPLPVDFNMTSNLYPIFKKALGEPIMSLNGRLGKDCLVSLDLAIKDIEKNPEKYKPMAPSNGWGSIESAIKTLKTLLDWAFEYPDAQFEITC